MLSHTADQKLFVGISGLIGSGKTFLSKKLADKLGVPVYYEDVSGNIYLEKFYKDMKRYSFQLQIYLLSRRFTQHQLITWTDKGGILDRTPYEDQVFCDTLLKSGLMEQDDYNTYVEFFGKLNNFMKNPNLIIYLDVKPEIAMERIKMRNRSMESGITLEYLTTLYEAYENFITRISKTIMVIRLDWNEFHDTDKVVDMILREYAKLSIVHHVNLSQV